MEADAALALVLLASWRGSFRLFGLRGALCFPVPASRSSADTAETLSVLSLHLDSRSSRLRWWLLAMSSLTLRRSPATACFLFTSSSALFSSSSFSFAISRSAILGAMGSLLGARGARMVVGDLVAARSTPAEDDDDAAAAAAAFLKKGCGRWDRCLKTVMPPFERLSFSFSLAPAPALDGLFRLSEEEGKGGTWWWVLVDVDALFCWSWRLSKDDPGPGPRGVSVCTPCSATAGSLAFRF